MAKEQLEDFWAKEDIPDFDALFMRVHKNLLKQSNEIRPKVFRPHGKGMSTDWEKYSTPDETLNRARKPKENGVIQLITGEIRKLPEKLIVEHTPITLNRAHTNVIGDIRDEEVRVGLSRIAKWIIALQ